MSEKQKNQSIIEEFRKLGLSLGIKNAAREKNRNISIDQVIDGQFHESKLGRSFWNEETFQFDEKHGNLLLNKIVDLSILKEFSLIDENFSPDLKRMVFFDTETSGLAFGAGTYIFLIGFGYYDDEGYKIRQYFLLDPSQEEAFLESFIGFLDQFDTFVSFNGKSFDLPMLRNRFRSVRFPFSYENYQHIDLLHLARKIWKLRLPSRKLGELEKHILNYKRGEIEIPSWMVPEMYTDYLKSGNAEPLKGVFYHNKIDVLSLALLLQYISEKITPVQAQELDSKDIFSIAKIYYEAQKYDDARQYFLSCLKAGPEKEIKVHACYLLGEIFRKSDNIQEGLVYWETAAEDQHLPSIRKLAIHFEHFQRDYNSALYWAEKLHKASLSVNDTINMGFDPGDTFHRIQRIKDKEKRENNGK